LAQPLRFFTKAALDIGMPFTDFDLMPSLQATLKEKEFVKPTEIQLRAIPLLLAGRSLVGVAETGTGKTLSFALPVLNMIKKLEQEAAVKDDAKPRAMVMVPTRELGEQVAKVFKTFTHTTRLRVRTVLGGTAMDVARRNVSGPFEILVATPGRLMQLIERRLIDLSDVRILIFDEADQMLDQGFLPDAKAIAARCPVDRQMAMFSATVSSSVQKLINELFSGAEVLRSKGSHRVVPALQTENRQVIDGKRWPLLETLLNKKIKGGTVIFTNTREQCDRLAVELKEHGKKCAIYRGEMDKIERRNNLKAFREGDVELLISTDLASRGLDVEHVERVINYHMPKHLENYIHRVGRTARAGRSGTVINFITERDEPMLEEIKSVSALS
jgi:ATP-dependent RNA helicase RhlE